MSNCRYAVLYPAKKWSAVRINGFNFLIFLVSTFVNRTKLIPYLLIYFQNFQVLIAIFIYFTQIIFTKLKKFKKNQCFWKEIVNRLFSHELFRIFMAEPRYIEITEISRILLSSSKYIVFRTQGHSCRRQTPSLIINCSWS